MAVGGTDPKEGGARIFTSPDGVQWSEAPAGAAALLRGIAYGKGRFVAVGHQGAILTSEDARRWALQTRGTTASLSGIAYGQDRFVAIGEEGTILSGAPGDPWETRRLGTGARLSDLAHGAGRFVAVGEKGTILTSPDGARWTQRTERPAVYFRDVAYGGDRFTAVGNEGWVATSADGVGWVFYRPLTAHDLKAVVYGQGHVVVAGGGGTVLSAQPEAEERRPGRMAPLTSVVYTSLVSKDGTVRTEPVPISMDSYSARFFRWSPDGRYLVYGREADIFLYDAQTRESRNLTRTPDRWELMPSWSPDGQYLAFTSRSLDPREGKPKRPGVYAWNAMFGCSCGSPTVIRRDGSGYRVLDQAETIHPASWSKEGRSLAYDHRGTVRLVDLETEQVRALGPAQVGLAVKYLGAPSWSPQRDELAFFFAEDDRGWTREELLAGKAAKVRQGYAVTDLATGTTRVLYEYRAPFMPRLPALWSADGERVALPFTCELILCDPVGLIVVDRAGERAERVVKDFYQAAWEPGGRRLVYIRNDDRRILQVLTPEGRGWRLQEIRHWNSMEGIAWRHLGGALTD